MADTNDADHVAIGPAAATGRAPHCPSLLALSRHTSRDSLVIATALADRNVIVNRADAGLAPGDVDDLCRVTRYLNGRHLNLVLHGAGGQLEAAAEVMSLLRGHFESIRALVPSAALTTMALVACACDVIIMPETAVIGPSDDAFHRPVSADEAREWLFRNLDHPDRAQRIVAVGRVFDATEGPRAPFSAFQARQTGLPINIAPERSAIGQSLEEVRHEVDTIMRSASLVKVIDCQDGPLYGVKG
jgi:hypothetical protein